MAVATKSKKTLAGLTRRSERLGTPQTIQVGPHRIMIYNSPPEKSSTATIPAVSQPPLPPIILLAGTFVSSRYWLRLMPYLPPERRIIAIDTIGVGQTDRARAPRDLALLAQSTILSELFSRMQLKQVDILGAAYGGNIGLIFAGLHPDLVRSVAAIEAPIFATSYGWLHQVRTGLEWLRAGHLPFWLVIKSGFLAQRWTNALLGRRLSTAPGFKKSSVFRCFYDPNARLSNWRALLHAPVDDPMRPLAGIRAPTLFLETSDSPLRGQLDHTHELLARLSMPLTWQTLPLAQHDVAVQLPVAVAQAVSSFWQSLP